MIFSKSCEYALKAVVYLSLKTEKGSMLNIKDIAKGIDSPEHFTAKILQSLVKKKIISSQKGPNGGFYIQADAAEIPLIDVIHAVSGEGFMDKCVMGLHECNDEHPCPLHDDFKAYNERIKTIVDKKTIQDLARSVQEGKHFLNTKGVTV